MRIIIIPAMTLDQLHPGDEARILSVRAGFGLQQRLYHLGIHPGDMVYLCGCGAFQGPLLVEVHGMQIAIGRGVARHVLVEPAPHAPQIQFPQFPRRFGGHRRHRWFAR